MIFHPIGRRFRGFQVAAGAVLLGMSATSQAEIQYRVKVDPVSKQVQVSIAVPSEPGPLSLQIPNWMPGHYVLDYYSKSLHDVSCEDARGAAVAFEHPDPNTWTISKPVGIVTFKYWVPIGAYKRFALPNDDTFVQLAGAVHLMYVVGRKTERCKISYDLPTGWPALTGLDPDRHSPNTFFAPNYDVLADNPLSTGNVLVDKYKLRGKDVFVVLEGTTKDGVDRKRLLGYCQFVSAAEAEFFGGVPYHRYVWHFIVNPGNGGGGLEHLSSTQITLPSRVTLGTVDLLAHEHFHLWNVKRIRPRVLGPFDYLKLPQTGALWWSEGVTDYYASLLPYRYGAGTRDQFLRAAGQNFGSIKGNPARLEVSPYQSSYRLAESSSARGPSGSNGGYKVSFYTLGWLCGLCLDTEIRFRSHGRHSLDDVMRSLYTLCKNSRPGFEEDEIRKQCIQFGGPELGPFYDKVVMSPGELPIGDQLAKMGLTLAQGTVNSGSLAFTVAAGPSGSATVKSVNQAQKEKLQDGDQIIAVDEVAASSAETFRLFDTLNDYGYAGRLDSIHLTLQRGGQTLTTVIEPEKRTSTRWIIADDPKASKEVIALRADWLRQTKLAEAP